MTVVVLESDQVDETTRLALRTLWDGAFADRFTTDDEAHAYGGVHVLARVGEPWSPTLRTRAQVSAGG